ncbi:hypothetical protein [Rhodococcus sp. UFZ-B548]|jgi:hypothetical protein|uniref:hypothetical protein n=1 Tax=Rhodococcus sp. UFZ-B548 TaxID=2742212 RepID=UPI0015F49EAE|nr:hypothetical protein [Rhodococcus sp. UFZ-B548]
MTRSPSTTTQQAVRILALLRVCGEVTGGNDPAGMVQVIRSEKRLQALNFWLVNPDYLADEVITAVDKDALDVSYLAIAEGLLNDPEPALHHYPTPKWFYGAYERIDDAFSLLASYGLAKVRRRGVPPKRSNNQFFLSEDGARVADEMAATTILDWYSKQAELVHLVAGRDSGTRLKERQYDQETYAEARWGNPIASIEEQVRKRLAENAVAAEEKNQTDMSEEQL